MQLASISNLPVPRGENTSVPSRRKVVKEEIELRERTEFEISPLWKIVTVLSYAIILVSGMATSISIGSLLAAFNNNCVLYARLTVRGLDEIWASGGNLTLYDENVVTEQYGSLSDCSFTEYCSVASAIFAGVWGILFLQCGRGGVTKRSSSPSWNIVLPALLTNLVFFVLSLITFAKTIGGLSYFCNHLRSETNTGETAINVTTCKDILAFHFPTDFYQTDLYYHYILAQVSSVVAFVGWLVTLFVLILRCFIPVDFVVYGRKLYEVQNISRDEQRRWCSQSTRSVDANLPSTATSVEYLDTENGNVVATTSFSIPESDRLKKLS